MRLTDWLETVGYLTGSRAFGVEKENSDYDWFVPHDVSVADWLDFLEENEYWQEADGDIRLLRNFISYRFDDVNVIHSLNAEFTAKWKLAHDECVQVRPRLKADRVRIFRKHLYGETNPQ